MDEDCASNVLLEQKLIKSTGYGDLKTVNTVSTMT